MGICVTPFEYYVRWILVGFGFLILNGLATYIAVRCALKG